MEPIVARYPEPEPHDEGPKHDQRRVDVWPPSLLLGNISWPRNQPNPTQNPNEEQLRAYLPSRDSSSLSHCANRDLRDEDP